MNDFFSAIQKVLPWASSLPLIPKIGVTAIIVFIAFTLVSAIWARQPDQTKDPEVLQSYNLMVKALGELNQRSDGKVVYEGNAVEPKLVPYFVPYLNIGKYVHAHPGDIPGAFETVAMNGGPDRIYINDTERLEYVVDRFFRAYESRGSQHRDAGS